MHTQRVSFTIFVLNQADTLRFNRGALLNIGYLMVGMRGRVGEGECVFALYGASSLTSTTTTPMQAEQEYDYLAMHDVDLMPLNPVLNYSFPTMPYHMAAPWLHPM